MKLSVEEVGKADQEGRGWQGRNTRQRGLEKKKKQEPHTDPGSKSRGACMGRRGGSCHVGQRGVGDKSSPVTREARVRRTQGCRAELDLGSTRVTEAEKFLVQQALHEVR